jgi:prepilin peptidase CpaA
MTGALTIVTLAILVTGSIGDLRDRIVPDVIPLLLVTVAIFAVGDGWVTHGGRSLALGGLVAAGIGAALFWFGGFGGGDVKVLVGLGCLVGVEHVLSLLFFIALAGGVAALLCLLRGTRELPYLPVMTAGFVVFRLWG